MSIQCGLQKLPEFTLVLGVGDYSKNQACVMSAAVACLRLSKGEPLGEATDQMDCCCPVIRKFLIRLNDSILWKSDQHRTEVLMPFVSRLAGTKNEKLTNRRVWILVDWSIRTITADEMERAKLIEQALLLRSINEITNKEQGLEAREKVLMCKSAAYAAADAYAAVYAYAAAAYAADAADAAYAADAADAAAYAADAAAYAADATKEKIIGQCVAVLERLLTLSE